MAIDIVGACSTAVDSSGAPGLAVILAVLFSVYIAADSLLASVVIRRKAAEAEAVTMKSLG